MEATAGARRNGAAGHRRVRPSGAGLAVWPARWSGKGSRFYQASARSYNEWEFVYDLSQDKSRQGLGTGAPDA